MMKLILSAITASMMLTPMAASAQSRTVIKERPGRTVVVEKNRHGQNVRRTVVQRQQPQQARRWARGQRFDRNQARNYRQIDYRQYQRRGVYAPPRGYQWVQSGNDAVLVALASGLIGAVVGGAILN